MKRLIVILFMFISFGAFSQTFQMPYLILRMYNKGALDSTVFSGDSVRHITNKSYYTFNKPIRAPDLIANGSSVIPLYFEKEISTDGENNIAVTVPLTSTTKIYYNGTIIGQSRWQGIGGTTLNLILDTKKNDKLIITN